MPRKYDGLTPYEGYEDAIVEKTDGVVTFTLNRPEKLNALSPALRFGLKRILEDVNDDDDAKVLVLTGAGRGFCAGADMIGQSHSSSPAPSRQDIEESRFGWIGRFRSMRKPVIAAVNGVRLAVVFLWRSPAMCGSRLIRRASCRHSCGAQSCPTNRPPGCCRIWWERREHCSCIG